MVPFLVTAWAYSNAPFVIALPFERTEAILEGMIAAFEFHGAVAELVTLYKTPSALMYTGITVRSRSRHRGTPKRSKGEDQPWRGSGAGSSGPIKRVTTS
jgi:hypothetical protein